MCELIVRYGNEFCEDLTAGTSRYEKEDKIR